MFLLVSVCCDTMFLLVSVCCDTMFLLVSVCCDTMFFLVSVCCDTAQAKAACTTERKKEMQTCEPVWARGRVEVVRDRTSVQFRISSLAFLSLQRLLFTGAVLWLCPPPMYETLK